MSALEIKRGKVHGQGMPDGVTCEWCRSERRYNRTANSVVWVLGRPLMRVCGRCRKRVAEAWEEARSA